jgi:hypothetical protein
MLCCAVSYKLTDVSEMRIASIIALMIEAVSTSETSVHFYEATRRKIPEESSYIYMSGPKIWNRSRNQITHRPVEYILFLASNYEINIVSTEMLHCDKMYIPVCGLRLPAVKM